MSFPFRRLCLGQPAGHTSQKRGSIRLDGKVQTLPLPALINLRSHPSADVGERAYKLEMATFEEMKKPWLPV